ncbi:hypothetical protein FACS1894137_12250 [Spirochaetia bacterium]|nr:hypothetical protein FACS1894137_12250 [Spirochaetia bacterium]
MSDYNLDLDYVFPAVDGPAEEYKAKYNEIIREADRIISENTANSGEIAKAYLKKAQCLRKFEITSVDLMNEKENPERRAEIRKYA